jgi:uncharacterized membrane protein YqhA
MLPRVLASSRYIVLFAVAATLVASIALILYEALVVAEVVFSTIRDGFSTPMDGKRLAVGLIEAIDVFLIAIVGLIIGLGLYALFIDNTLPLPRWLEIHDFEDLKMHLVRILVAVLAVLFLREAVERAKDPDLLKLAAALALMIAVLTFFLSTRGPRKE